ncbi:hypothetical protein M378DRAFT_9664 [Amanita muscaria Koide BX008]|uniref:C2H2-type domain-containing protein n=1 Tax=Amanita muscaria (strain Koide BX008) TaxID=946122 RepID=A0A0C2SU91_AMAMK|nr:hypothetical protein M378DRAFT_9664 [Amanita muscaria Koide BX008]
MGKKKNKQLLRPWCWYCEREFEDEKVLMQHQKAKHFKCGMCPRRLNTAGGLAVHIQQVHKLEPENLPRIENALPGRDGYEVEIFGMVGIPAPDVADYKRRKEIELGLSAGSISQPPQKKAKIENKVYSEEELKAQLQAHKALMGVSSSPEKPPAPESSAVYGAPPQAYAAPPVPASMMPPPGIMPPMHMSMGSPFPPGPSPPIPPGPPGLIPPFPPHVPGLPPGLPPGLSIDPAFPPGVPNLPPGISPGPTPPVPPGISPPPGVISPFAPPIHGMPPGPPPPGLNPAFPAPGLARPPIPPPSGWPPGGAPVLPPPQFIPASQQQPSAPPHSAQSQLDGNASSRPTQLTLPNPALSQTNPEFKKPTDLKYKDPNFAPEEHRGIHPKYYYHAKPTDGATAVAEESKGKKRARAEDFL